MVGKTYQMTGKVQLRETARRCLVYQDRAKTMSLVVGMRKF